jgi:hypothetical protein
MKAQGAGNGGLRVLRRVLDLVLDALTILEE